MTQQKLLPIARRITGGFNVPLLLSCSRAALGSDLAPAACRWGKAGGQGNAGWWLREREGRRGGETGLVQGRPELWGRTTGSCWVPSEW